MSKELKELVKKISPKVSWAGLRKVEDKTLYVSARNGVPEDVSSSTGSGLMLEILHKGQFAYAGVPSFSAADIERTTEKLIVVAEKASNNPLFEATPEMRPPSTGNYEGAGYHSVGNSDLKILADYMTELSGLLSSSEEILSGTAHSSITETVTTYVSTSGADLLQKNLRIGGNLRATAQVGGVIQSRSHSSLESRSYQQSLDAYMKLPFREEAPRIAEEAIELTMSEECPTGVFPLVLAPDQMYLQIHESIGHPLELDRILGDERNYAGWSFVKPKDFGTLQYGSSLMNVSFDPQVKGELASYSFDDCGAPAKREMIIEDGLLLRGLGGLESQHRSGLPGVACQRACSWNRPPIDRMANLNLEPGESTFSEIISSIDYGVMMMSNRSWSIDDYRNKFQFGCEYGKLIEKGKLTRTLRNPNYRGVTIPFWHSLKMVGNKDTVEVMGTPFCGKGEPNQSIYVGHASPVCLFNNVEVFGGAI